MFRHARLLTASEDPRKSKASAALKSPLDDAAWQIVRLIQEMVEQRVHQRMKIDGNALVVDSSINTLGNIGYRALQNHLIDAFVELLRRLVQGTRVAPPADVDAFIEDDETRSRSDQDAAAVFDVVKELADYRIAVCYGRDNKRDSRERQHVDELRGRFKRALDAYTLKKRSKTRTTP